MKYRAGVDVFLVNGVVLNGVWCSHAAGLERTAFNATDGESGGYLVDVRGVPVLTSIVPYDGLKQFPVPMDVIVKLTAIAQTRIAMLQEAQAQQRSRLITGLN